MLTGVSTPKPPVRQPLATAGLPPPDKTAAVLRSDAASEVPFGSWRIYAQVQQAMLFLVILCMAAVVGIAVYTFVFNKGSQGPKGVVGDPGPTGATGATGPTGVRGQQGLIGPQGVQGPVGNQGPPGPLGPAGRKCHDINGNNACDGSEDVNGDNDCTVDDCKGPGGDRGLTGFKGPTGDQGPPGPGGGTNCWNEDGTGNCTTTYPDCNVSRAGVNDKNCDGYCTYLDCQGVPCWDRPPYNWICDPLTEDVNGDGNCTQADCLGPTGATGATGSTGPTGAPGATGGPGPTGATGQQGLQCHDKSGDGVCQRFCTLPAPNGIPLNASNEDTNCDGVCDYRDCAGPAGATGATGATGAQGQKGDPGATGATGATGSVGPTGATGTAGYDCWDTSPANRACDLSTEDIDGDGNCTNADCNAPIYPGVFTVGADARSLNFTNITGLCTYLRTYWAVRMQCSVTANLTVRAAPYSLFLTLPTVIQPQNGRVNDTLNTTTGSFINVVSGVSQLWPENAQMNPRIWGVGSNSSFAIRMGDGIQWSAAATGVWTAVITAYIEYSIR